MKPINNVSMTNTTNTAGILKIFRPTKFLAVCLMVLGLCLATVGVKATIYYNISAYVPPPVTLIPTQNTQYALAKVPSNNHQDYYFNATCGKTYIFTVNYPYAPAAFPLNVAVYDPWGNLIRSVTSTNGAPVQVGFQAAANDWYSVVVTSLGAGGSTYMAYGIAIW